MTSGRQRVRGQMIRVGAIVLWSLTAVYGEGLPESSWWPVWRHDGQRTSRTALRGAITDPSISWRYYLGSPQVRTVDNQTWQPVTGHDLTGTGQLHEVLLTVNQVAVREVINKREVWSYQLDPESGPWTYRAGDIHPEEKGRELVVFSSGTQAGKGKGYAFSFSEGVEHGRLLWKVAPPNMYFSGTHLCLADLDGDGAAEVITTPWYQTVVWDGRTGTKRHDIPFASGRNYGMTAAVNVDDDPHLEIAVIADYVPHIDVIDFDVSGARVLWQKEFRPGVNSGPWPQGYRDLMIRARPNSLVDLDNDGKAEMTLNLFNAGENGDGKWHLMVYRMATGEVLVDCPDTFVWGIRDLNDDRHYELLCLETSSSYPRTPARATVFAYNQQRLQPLWNRDQVSYVLETRKTLPTSLSSGAKEGMVSVFLGDIDDDSVSEFVVQQDTDSDRLMDRFEAFSMGADGKIHSKWLFQSTPGTLLQAQRFNGSGLRFLEPETGDLLRVDQHGTLVRRDRSTRTAGYTTTPVAADVDGDGHCEIAVVNSRDEVELLRVGSSGGKSGPAVVWKRKGHGMVWQQGYTLPGLTLAMGDLGSDGQVETLFCGENERGNATLAAVRADGSVFWEHEFHGIGTDGVYSGLSRWFVGDFVGDSSPDVGVVHNRVRGANEMTVLEGNTGRAIWTTKPFMAPGSTQSVAIGGPPVSAVYDFNQDGKDDISYMPVWFTLALSGRSGQWLNGRYVTDIYPRTLNYPYLFLTDVTGDGSMEILLHGPYMHTMAQTYKSMQMLWFREFEGNTSNFFPPAVSDVDHDGIKELGMPGEDGIFRCIRASDGAVIWQEDLGLPGYSNVGAADVDGNGVEDFFYYSRSGSLVVVRGALKPGEKRLLWQLPIGPLVGGRQHPIFVDTDADGSGEFLLVSGSGHLVCVDQEVEETR